MSLLKAAQGKAIQEGEFYCMQNHMLQWHSTRESGCVVGIVGHLGRRVLLTLVNARTMRVSSTDSCLCACYGSALGIVMRMGGGSQTLPSLLATQKPRQQQHQQRT